MNSLAAIKTANRLSEGQRAALISLLADEDTSVYQTVRAKLVSFGDEAIVWLQPHTLSNEPLLRRRAREIIHFFGAPGGGRPFPEFLRQPGGGFAARRGRVAAGPDAVS